MYERFLTMVGGYLMSEKFATSLWEGYIWTMPAFLSVILRYFFVLSTALLFWEESSTGC